jgi:hypothetical protein
MQLANFFSHFNTLLSVVNNHCSLDLVPFSEPEYYLILNSVFIHVLEGQIVLSVAETAFHIFISSSLFLNMDDFEIFFVILGQFICHEIRNHHIFQGRQVVTAILIELATVYSLHHSLIGVL